MFRTIAYSVSALALLTSAANANPDAAASETAAEDDNAAIIVVAEKTDGATVVTDTQMSAEETAEIFLPDSDNVMLAQPAAVLDAAHVTTKNDAILLAEAEFKQADIDADGKISKAEFIAYASVKTTPTVHAEAEAVTMPLPASVDVEPEGDSDETDKIAEAPAMNADEQFVKLANGDEDITKDELVEQRVAVFEEADINDDQLLDDTERQQFAALTAIAKPADNL